MYRTVVIVSECSLEINRVHFYSKVGAVATVCVRVHVYVYVCACVHVCMCVYPKYIV